MPGPAWFGTSGFRLRHAYVSADWGPHNEALDSYRVDPAPPNVTPLHSRVQILAAFRRMYGRAVELSGTTSTVLFGLYTGNEPIVGPPPNHTLMGARAIRHKPGWIIVVNGVSLTSEGGPGNPGSSPRPVPPPQIGYVVTVLSDADEHDWPGLYDTAPAVLHLH